MAQPLSTTSMNQLMNMGKVIECFFYIRLFVWFHLFVCLLGVTSMNQLMTEGKVIGFYFLSVCWFVGMSVCLVRRYSTKKLQ